MLFYFLVHEGKHIYANAIFYEKNIAHILKQIRTHSTPTSASSFHSPFPNKHLLYRLEEAVQFFWAIQ